MTEQNPNATCAWCNEPATTRVRLGRRQHRVAACALHKAQAERKNLYMPCVISADFDAMTPAEQARVWKSTYWADNITNTEWPAVLRHDGVKAYVRSKLKRKAVGWVMAFSRILWLNPTLGAQVLREADALYREQVREDPPIPWAQLADLIEQGWTQDGLAAWMRPLGSLRAYTPGALEAVAAKLAETADGWDRLPEDGNQEDAA